MRLGMLGTVEMWEAGGTVPLGPLRQRAVLAALLVDADQVVPVDVLVDRVWGADAPERAPRTLHTYITRLRHLVGTDRVLRRPGGYLLAIDPDQVDLHRFRRLVAQAGTDEVAAGERVTRLREAVGLWRGQPLAGIGGEWAERMRRGWCRERVDAAVCWARAELTAGDPAAVCAPLGELIEEHPLVEPAVEVLMRALAATGRTAEALREYAALRTRLTNELGADPGTELQATHQALLRPEVGNPPPTPRPGTRRSVTAGKAEPERHLVVHVVHRRAPVLGTALAAALAACSVVVLSLLMASAPEPTAVPLPPAWTARTSQPAPLLAPSGRPLQTIPANTAITVACWYPGNPGQPWHGNGIEYHVEYHTTSRVSSGHIPDPYLTFDTRSPDRPPTGLRHCRLQISSDHG